MRAVPAVVVSARMLTLALPLTPTPTLTLTLTLTRYRHCDLDELQGRQGGYSSMRVREP